MQRITGVLAALLLTAAAARAQGVAVVSSPGSDACAAINTALQSLTNGGTVDARNLVGTVTCASNMFAGVTPDTTASNERAFTVLLGPATFVGHVSQVQPRNAAVYGVWGGGTGSSADPQWSGTKFRLDDTTHHDVTLWQLRNAHNSILNGVSFDCILATGCIGILVRSDSTFGAWRNRIENFTIAHAAQGIHIGSGNSGCGTDGTVSCDASGLIIRNGTIREGIDRFSGGTQTAFSSGIWIEGANAAQGSIIESVLFQNLHTGIWIEKYEQAMRISSIDCGAGRGANSTCIVVGDVQNLVVQDSRNEIDDASDSASSYRFMRIQTPSKIYGIVLRGNLFNGGRQSDGSYIGLEVNSPAYIVSIGNGGAGRAVLNTNNASNPSEVVSIGDRFPWAGSSPSNFSGWVDATGVNRINRIN